MKYYYYISGPEFSNIGDKRAFKARSIYSVQRQIDNYDIRIKKTTKSYIDSIKLDITFVS